MQNAHRKDSQVIVTRHHSTTTPEMVWTLLRVVPKIQWNQPSCRGFKHFLERISLEKLTERQDSMSTPDHEDYVCITCNKHLSKQVAVHNRTFSSDSGDELFMQKGNLLIHKDQTYFTCTTCARIFPKRTQLSTHIRIHISDKPYSSESCSRSFSQQTTLNSHICIYTGEKPYLCTICGKRYGHSSTLIC